MKQLPMPDTRPPTSQSSPEAQLSFSLRTASLRHRLQKTPVAHAHAKTKEIFYQRYRKYVQKQIGYVRKDRKLPSRCTLMLGKVTR